jgi:hypothetical protein
LRQTQALIALGAASAQMGQRELGRAYLDLAKKLAEHQGYRLRGAEAEEHLHELESGQALDILDMIGDPRSNAP